MVVDGDGRGLMAVGVDGDGGGLMMVGWGLVVVVQVCGSSTQEDEKGG